MGCHRKKDSPGQSYFFLSFTMIAKPTTKLRGNSSERLKDNYEHKITKGYFRNMNMLSFSLFGKM